MGRQGDHGSIMRHDKWCLAFMAEGLYECACVTV